MFHDIYKVFHNIYSGEKKKLQNGLASVHLSVEIVYMELYYVVIQLKRWFLIFTSLTKKSRVKAWARNDWNRGGCCFYLIIQISLLNYSSGKKISIYYHTWFASKSAACVV